MHVSYTHRRLSAFFNDLVVDWAASLTWVIDAKLLSSSACSLSAIGVAVYRFPCIAVVLGHSFAVFSSQSEIFWLDLRSIACKLLFWARTCFQQARGWSCRVVGRLQDSSKSVLQTCDPCRFLQVARIGERSANRYN